MGFEIRRNLHLKAHHVCRIVLVLLAAFIAADRHPEIDLRRWRVRVGLAQRNFVPAEHVLFVVVFVVLADYNPDVLLVPTPSTPGSHRAPLPDLRRVTAEGGK